MGERDAAWKMVGAINSVTSIMRRVRCNVLMLATSATVILCGCDLFSAEQKSEFTIIETGITLQGPANFAWCDATHVAAYRIPKGAKEATEVVYFAISDPFHFQRIDLTNPEKNSPTRTLRVSNLHCFDNQL